MLNLKHTLSAGLLLAAIPIAAVAIFALKASAQTPPKPESAPAAAIFGDADAGADFFESVCAECHGAAATAPTLRGVIGRPIASVADFDYSEALKAKKSMTWTQASLNAFIKSPPDFAPGTLMNKKVPDAQNRADVIAYIASLPPPR